MTSRKRSDVADRNRAAHGPADLAAKFRAALAAYSELRRQGVDSWAAAEQIGIDPGRTRQKYERWYRAGLGEAKR
jgi:hypothetical protein